MRHDMKVEVKLHEFLILPYIEATAHLYGPTSCPELNPPPHKVLIGLQA